MRRLYWVKEGLKVVGIIFGATALYSLFMLLMNPQEDLLGGFLQQGAIYFVVFCVLMALLNNMSAHQTIIPLSLSFGCTRKEAICGIQLYRLTVLAFLVIGAFVLFGLLLSDISILFLLAIPAMIGAYLFFAGLGGLLGTFVSKVSKAVLGVISGFTILFIIICISFLFAMMGFETDMEVYTILPWIALMIGAAVYGICSIFEVRSIKRHYVR